MIQLFKIRTFSDYFSDTIAFFKVSGKHFFKNYFVINGGFLMILIVMIYFVINFYVQALSNTFGDNNVGADPFTNLIEQNLPIFIGFLLLFVLLIIIISILNIAYPVIYLDLYEKNKGNQFSTKQILSELKNNFGRILIFSLGTIFFYMPLFIIVIGVCLMLCFIIIGIPLLLIVFPALYSMISIAFYDYLVKKSTFFEAFSVGIATIRQDIWGIAGGTFLMMMLVQILQTVITMIPYIIGIFYFFMSNNDLQNINPQDQMGLLAVFLMIIFIISIVFGYLANNLLVVAQGMMYYSGREKLESNATEDLIGKIGSDFE